MDSISDGVAKRYLSFARTYIHAGASVNWLRALHIRLMQTRSSFHIQNRLDSHSSRDEVRILECFSCLGRVEKDATSDLSM